MKKTYVKPAIDKKNFEIEDVITTSVIVEPEFSVKNNWRI